MKQDIKKRFYQKPQVPFQTITGDLAFMEAWLGLTAVNNNDTSQR
jgi:hypothetical protein